MTNNGKFAFHVMQSVGTDCGAVTHKFEYQQRRLLNPWLGVLTPTHTYVPPANSSEKHLS